MGIQEINDKHPQGKWSKVTQPAKSSVKCKTILPTTLQNASMNKFGYVSSISFIEPHGSFDNLIEPIWMNSWSNLNYIPAARNCWCNELGFICDVVDIC